MGCAPLTEWGRIVLYSSRGRLSVVVVVVAGWRLLLLLPYLLPPSELFYLFWSLNAVTEYHNFSLPLLRLLLTRSVDLCSGFAEKSFPADPCMNLVDQERKRMLLLCMDVVLERGCRIVALSLPGLPKPGREKKTVFLLRWLKLGLRKSDKRRERKK